MDGKSTKTRGEEKREKQAKQSSDKMFFKCFRCQKMYYTEPCAMDAYRTCPNCLADNHPTRMVRNRFTDRE